MIQASLRPCGDDRKRIGQAVRHGIRTFERVDGNVHDGCLPRAQFFTDIQFVRFILGTFADDNLAEKIYCVELRAHRIHCRFIRELRFTFAYPLRGGYRGDFGHPDKLESKIVERGTAVGFHKCPQRTLPENGVKWITGPLVERPT